MDLQPHPRTLVCEPRLEPEIVILLVRGINWARAGLRWTYAFWELTAG